MKWNLRLAAAHRGIWTASEMQRMLAARGLSVSAGKMSGLWSGSPGGRRARGHAQAPRRPHPAAALRWAGPRTRPATGPAAAPTAWPGE